MPIKTPGTGKDKELNGCVNIDVFNNNQSFLNDQNGQLLNIDYAHQSYIPTKGHNSLLSTSQGDRIKSNRV
jgi:hypothetical protein